MEKYIGDAIMVHSGAPRPRGEDTARALAYAGAMTREILCWNAESEAVGKPRNSIGVGCHFGEVLAGNIGEKRRLEYTVLGDTDKVASGLERLTREINASIVVSDELVRAAMENDAWPDELVANLRIVGERPVRGRRQPIRIWSNSEFE